MRVTDSIFWGNYNAQDVYDRNHQGPAFLKVIYSDTEATAYLAKYRYIDITGEGVIHKNPPFVNLVLGDYNIEETSPCKGTGFDGTDMSASF